MKASLAAYSYSRMKNYQSGPRRCEHRGGSSQ